MDYSTLLLVVKLTVIIAFAILVGFAITRMAGVAPRRVPVVLMAVAAVITALPVLIQALEI